MARIPGQLPNYSWIKFEIDYLERRDFMELQPATKGIFLLLYLMAGKSNNSGMIAMIENNQIPMTLKDISWYCRIDKEIIKAAIDELLDANLVRPFENGFEINNFMDEQGPGQEDDRKDWIERSRKYRERRKNKEEEKEIEEDTRTKTESLTVTIPILTGDNTHSHGDNSNDENSPSESPSESPSGSASSSFLKEYFEKHLKDRHIEYFVSINEVYKPLKISEGEIKYWVDIHKKYGDILFEYWEWACGASKTGKDAYNIAKANPALLENWEDKEKRAVFFNGHSSDIYKEIVGKK